MVLGFVSDKSLDEVLKLFPKKAKYYFAKPDIPRGMDAKILMEEARGFGLKGRTYVSVKNALKAAKRAAKPNDLIYVGGSIFVVAEVI
jgi:dihydrofolate synthase/folylpolyglutamate synthase